MDFFELVEKRRSIRKYEERSIELEKIEKMLESVLRAPSARGRRPWEFVVVTEPQLIEKLANSRMGGNPFLRGAALAVAVCASEESSDVWVEDTSIACTYLLLAAEALGLGACWIQIRERKHSPSKSSAEYVREVLELPPGIKVTALLSVGYPGEQKPPYEREELPFAKIHREKYAKK